MLCLVISISFANNFHCLYGTATDPKPVVKRDTLCLLAVICIAHSDAAIDPKPVVKQDALYLLTAVCATHFDVVATHLTKIIAYVVRRLKDIDSAIRKACSYTMGALVTYYLKS